MTSFRTGNAALHSAQFVCVYLRFPVDNGNASLSTRARHISKRARLLALDAYSDWSALHEPAVLDEGGE